MITLNISTEEFNLILELMKEAANALSDPVHPTTARYALPDELDGSILILKDSLLEM